MLRFEISQANMFLTKKRNPKPTLFSWRFIYPICFIFSMLAAPLHTISQAIHENVHYLNYTIEDGLPSLETYDVFHDSKGFTWIGTDNGVVLYDGYTFKTFTTDDGLTDNTIFRIKEDSFGRIWFLTYNKKLCYYDQGKFESYKFNSQLQNALIEFPTSYTLTDFLISPDENISLLSLNFEFIQIDNKGNTSIKREILNRKEYLSFLKYTNPKRLYIEVKTKDEFKSNFQKFIFENYASSRVHIIKGRSVDFIGSSQGLIIANKKNEFRTILSDYYITGVSEDFEGGWWCSTLNNGIVYIPSPFISFYKYPGSKTLNFYGIVPQTDKVVFCWDIGKNIYEIQDSILLPYPERLVFTNIPNYHLNVGFKTENPIKYENVYDPVASIAMIDSNRFVFPPDNHGLTIIDTSLSLTSLHQINALPYVKSEFNVKWFHSKNGQYSWREHSPIYLNKRITTFRKQVQKISKSLNNDIFICSTEGIFELNTDNYEIQPSKLFEDLGDTRIQDLIQLKDSSYIIATKASGLFYNQNGHSKSISSTNPDYPITFYQLVYDTLRNTILASSNRGIFLLSSKNNQWTLNHVINESDGMKTSDIRQVYVKNNTVFFANSKGASRIKYSDLLTSIPAPRINYLTTLVEKDIPSHYNLSYDSNNLEFNYKAISYRPNHKIQYQYRLQPLQTEWQITENLSVPYYSLQPGDYIFEVKAINVDGIEGQVQSQIFTIHPAFWMTIWFKILMIIIAILFIYYLSYSAISYYKRQADLQKNLKEMQAISLQAKMNPHFIFNSLNSIQNYILKNEKQSANEYLLDFSKLIRTILYNSDSIRILLDNELNTLQMYIDLEQKRLRKSFKYEVQLSSNIDVNKCYIPSLLLQPYVENAIWHGKVYNNPEGKICINITRTENIMHFEISDNGIGIDNATKSKVKKPPHKSVGSEITRKRIQLLGDLNSDLSDIEITPLHPENNTFTGTIISFNIPYHTNN